MSRDNVDSTVFQCGMPTGEYLGKGNTLQHTRDSSGYIKMASYASRGEGGFFIEN